MTSLIGNDLNWNEDAAVLMPFKFVCHFQFETNKRFKQMWFVISVYLIPVKIVYSIPDFPIKCSILKNVYKTLLFAHYAE